MFSVKGFPHCSHCNDYNEENTLFRFIAILFALLVHPLNLTTENDKSRVLNANEPC